MRNLRTLALAGLLTIGASMRLGAGEAILVDDFERAGPLNHLGERHAVYQQAPSWAQWRLAADPDDSTNTVLELRHGTAAEGWCGWYTLLGDLDASSNTELSLRVRGAEGGEDFSLQIKDTHIESEDLSSVTLGTLSRLLPSGITTEWQTVTVGLTRVAGQVELNHLASLVIAFPDNGEETIFIDDIMLCSDEAAEDRVEEMGPLAVALPDRPRSMWVWLQDPVAEPERSEALLAFCQQTHVERIFLYQPPELPDDSSDYASALSGFLAQAHSAGVAVEPMIAGLEDFLPENHERVASWVAWYARFNESHPPDQQVAGVALDVEPHVTEQWREDRAGSRRNYLEMLRSIRRRLVSMGSDLPISAAVPVHWASEPDDFLAMICEEVDALSIMDYFDAVPMILRGAHPVLQIAAEHGTGVWVGVETQDLITLQQGTSANTFFEEGWAAMESVLGDVAADIGDDPAFLGFAIHCHYSYRVLQRDSSLPLRRRPNPYRLVVQSGQSSSLSEAPVLCSWNRADQLALGQENWHGIEDHSATLRAVADESALSLRFDVIDDVIIQADSGTAMWRGDHIEIWFDTDLEGDYEVALNSADDWQLGLSPGDLAETEPEAFIWAPLECTPSTIQVTAEPVSGGYRITSIIPWEAIGLDSAPERLGIMIDPSDTDDADLPQESLFSTSPDRVWGDPTTFGILELVP